MGCAMHDSVGPALWGMGCSSPCRRGCRPPEAQKADRGDGLARIFHNRRRSTCGKAGLAIDGNMVAALIMRGAGDELAIGIVGPQGKQLEHDVIAAKVYGKVQRRLLQHVAGIDVSTTAEGLFGADE